MEIIRIPDTLKNSGRRVVGCFPLYPPLELVHSMGLLPVVLWELHGAIPAVRISDRHLQTYSCSVARRLCEFVLGDEDRVLDGLLIYNACDTLRNLPEILESGMEDAARKLPIVKMHIPMVPERQTDSSGYFSARIDALVRDLEKAFDVSFSPDKFRESVALYREMKRCVLALQDRVAAGTLGYGDFTKLVHEGNFVPVEEQLERLKGIVAEDRDIMGGHGPENSAYRVILSGILPPPRSLINTIQKVGLRVAGNDIASQHRSCCYTPEEYASPAEYYGDLYRHHFPCPTLLFSADRRIDALKDLVLKSRAGGFIFVGEKFCEYEYFEYPHVAETLNRMGIATLFLEISIDDHRNTDAFTTRIEAFAELLGSHETEMCKTR